MAKSARRGGEKRDGDGNDTTIPMSRGVEGGGRLARVSIANGHLYVNGLIVAKVSS